MGRDRSGLLVAGPYVLGGVYTPLGRKVSGELLSGGLLAHPIPVVGGRVVRADPASFALPSAPEPGLDESLPAVGPLPHVWQEMVGTLELLYQQPTLASSGIHIAGTVGPDYGSLPGSPETQAVGGNVAMMLAPPYGASLDRTSTGPYGLVASPMTAMAHLTPSAISAVPSARGLAAQLGLCPPKIAPCGHAQELYVLNCPTHARAIAISLLITGTVAAVRAASAGSNGGSGVASVLRSTCYPLPPARLEAVPDAIRLGLQLAPADFCMDTCGSEAALLRHDALRTTRSPASKPVRRVSWANWVSLEVSGRESEAESEDPTRDGLGEQLDPIPTQPTRATYHPLVAWGTASEPVAAGV